LAALGGSRGARTYSTLCSPKAREGREVRLFVATGLTVTLLVGCASQADKAEEKDEGEETTVTQAPPRSEAVEKTKNKAAANWTRPNFEVRNVRPGTSTSSDVSLGWADVFLTDFGGRPYGVMRNDPVLQEIADEIRADNPEYQMMVVSVYSGTEKREDRFMSNWYSFESPTIEQEFLADFEKSADEIIQEFKDKQAQQNAKK